MSNPHSYSIRPLDPAAHLFEVRVTVSEPAADGQIFRIPAWIPGSYMIRDYARHVVAISAESDGVGVALSKIDKSSWKAAPVERELTLRLEIYAYDESVRGAHLDNTHAYFNGTCVFPAVRRAGRQALPAQYCERGHCCRQQLARSPPRCAATEQKPTVLVSTRRPTTLN